MKVITKRFEQLTSLELYLILQARAEVFALEQKIVYQDMDNLDQKSTHIFIIENGELISYARLIDPGVKYDEPSIGRVLTVKPARGKHYATQILLTALMHAQKFNMPVRIEAQSYLREYYEKQGFEAISDEFLLEGIKHISMIHPPLPKIETL